MKTLLTTAALAAGTAFGGAAFAQQDCGEVTITEMNWASAAVVTSVADFLMAQGYGCDVRVVPSSNVPALVSVAETGEPDIVTELWTNGTPVYDEMNEEGTIATLTDVLSDGGVDGWWIPKYLADAHPELTTIEGLMANPELAGGRFHQCPEGWGCKNINNGIFRATGFEDAGFEIFQHGSGETMATSIASAYENEEPWLGYYWAPTSILGQYEMVQVDLGPYNAEAHACNADPDCDEVGMSSFPPAPVKTVVTPDFVESHPEVTEMLSNLAFTNEQMNGLLAWQEENNASADETAVYFLSNNSDVWSQWVDDAAREKLAALIQ
ncbi:ABC transporter substrate-binding protein [uncultured Jannaschia sp.]|uniref:ABC transporter substrate-binding protein n=1 Tax=uncultured Jannaschia sp. TaxID=293347 RepID=UPI0026045967|nr:ABC transporter substrate-binding protein [uncultured Jannaschia sp.]